MACMVALAALLLRLCGGPDVPWAESPALLLKATDPSPSAVLSAEEVLHRPHGDPSPRFADRTAASPGEWRWFGRSIPALDPGIPDGFWHASLGNEVGDHMFQESRMDVQENRNPYLSFGASAPLGSLARAGLRFDQNDHFSNRMLAVRLSLTNTQPETEGTPGVRRAFFGENRPGHSMVEASVASLDRSYFSARTGWIWLPSPGAGELDCWRATTMAGRVRAGSVEWHHAHGLLERADTARGGIVQFQGWLVGDPFGSSLFSIRPSFAYGSVTRHGEVPWKPGADLLAQPGFDVSSRFGGWHLAGSHRMGTAFHLHRDTIRWTAGSEAWTATLSASGRWTDRPDGAAPWTDSSTAGTARMDSRALEQTYATGVEVATRFGRFTFEASSTPWWIVHPRAFVPDSFAVFARSGADEWIVRSGSERALDGVLRGWKSSLDVDATVADSVHIDAGLRHDPILGGPEGGTDLVPPEWAASAGLRFGHRSGFSIHPAVVWRDESILRHRSPGDWVVPSGFDANLWIHQSYFRERLVFSMAALNILAKDRIQVPNAGEDRFRILVRVSGRILGL